MRKIWAIAILLALATVLTTPAFASSVHLKGDHSNPLFTDNGLTLTGSGALSGLGFGDVLVNISAVANPTGTCGNPGGNTFQATGQNPAPVAVTGSVSIPAGEIKNGNTPFSVTTNSPTTPIPGAPDCPNSSWTEITTDMSFTSAVITVEQPPPHSCPHCQLYVQSCHLEWRSPSGKRKLHQHLELEAFRSLALDKIPFLHSSNPSAHTPSDTLAGAESTTKGKY